MFDPLTEPSQGSTRGEHRSPQDERPPMPLPSNDAKDLGPLDHPCPVRPHKMRGHAQ